MGGREGRECLFGDGVGLLAPFQGSLLYNNLKIFLQALLSLYEDSCIRFTASERQLGDEVRYIMLFWQVQT